MARALYSKLIVDGNPGPVTISALHVYMRNRQGTSVYNGSTGGTRTGTTHRGLQRWMQKYGYYKGYDVDGYWGTVSISEFRRMINGKYRSSIPYPMPSGNQFTYVNTSHWTAPKALQTFLNYYRFV